LTAIIPFEHLRRETHAKIVARVVEKVKYDAMGISDPKGKHPDFFDGEIEFTDHARKLLLDTLQDDPSGARNLIRTVANMLEEAYIGYYGFRQSTLIRPTNTTPPAIGVDEVRRALKLGPVGKTKAAKG
jgi:ATP-dependent Clp protease ATP-binding subunit ClpA